MAPQYHILMCLCANFGPPLGHLLSDLCPPAMSSLSSSPATTPTIPATTPPATTPTSSPHQKSYEPKDAVRRAIKLYDLEIQYTEQPEEVMDEVEQILKMKGIQWPTPHYRRMTIARKMKQSLRKVLASYRLVVSLLYAIETC
jgi:hypothetical protein